MSHGRYSEIPNVMPRPMGSRSPTPCVFRSQAKMPFCTCMRLAGLLNDHALRPVDHLVGDFFAAAGGQAVHEERPFLGVRHQGGVDLVCREIARGGSRAQPPGPCSPRRRYRSPRRRGPPRSDRWSMSGPVPALAPSSQAIDSASNWYFFGVGHHQLHAQLAAAQGEAARDVVARRRPRPTSALAAGCRPVRGSYTDRPAPGRDGQSRSAR